MTTFLDSLIAPIAKNVIRQFGATITYKRIQKGAYSSANSSSTPTETVITGVKALVEDYTLVDSGAGFSSGLIESGDKKITIAGTELSFVPSSGDQVTAQDGKVYRIVRVQNTYSGDEVALYELQGRK